MLVLPGLSLRLESRFSLNSGDKVAVLLRGLTADYKRERETRKYITLELHCLFCRGTQSLNLFFLCLESLVQTNCRCENRNLLNKNHTRLNEAPSDDWFSVFDDP